ncbi:hypothetical protein K7432_017500 [Basidiobolus ranarum]|uniref:Uncharacterized protein n=1 Tax=Basidiobolus ranarum TaxID=34480 RepID=A0ABR2WDA6_9FUNG
MGLFSSLTIQNPGLKFIMVHFSFALFATTAAILPFTLLYKSALKEGGLVSVFAGGDLPNGGAGLAKAFESKFPDTKLSITVDLSKFHDELIDKQLAMGGDALEPDVTHLQTVHDFPRWKVDGALMR